MATGLDLVRMPGFAFPENARLDFTPLRQALQHRTEMGFRQSQEERERERLGLDRDRFGLQERQFEHTSAHAQRQFELDQRRFESDAEARTRGLGLQERGVGVQEGQFGLQRTEQQRLEEERQRIRMANEAHRIMQAPPVERLGLLRRLAGNSQTFADFFTAQGINLDHLGGEGQMSVDQVLGRVISQVPDATERYRPAPLVSAPPGHTLGRQTPEGGFEAVHTTPTVLTPGDRGAIREADAFVSTAQEASALIERALALSPQAYDQRIGALTRAQVERHAPSLEFHNIVSQLMLTQLRTIFGGNPTEGEREVLAQVQGSIHQPRAVRERILQRAAVLVQQRERAAREQAAAIRAGTYYQPGGGQPQPPPGGGGQQPPGTAGAPQGQVPTRPSSVPAGAAWSPSRRQWRAPDGRLYGADGQPVR